MNLSNLLDQYDKCQLECDGLTRVLHTVLSKNRISHIVKLGRVEDKVTGSSCSPHLWIELSDGRIVDYRARMWLGRSAPHGIFSTATTRFVYRGKEENIEILDDFLFKLLTGGR